MDGNITPEAIALLREIKNAVSENPNSKYYIAIIGMAGIVIGQLIQLLIAKLNASNEQNKQKIALKAEIITKQRQEWMDSIRQAATEFLVACDTIYNSKMAPALFSDDKKVECALAALSKAHFIELKLNKNKKTQNNVIKSMHSLHSILSTNSIVSDIPEFKSSYMKATVQFKDDLVALFNETWQRIKTLD